MASIPRGSHRPSRPRPDRSPSRKDTPHDGAGKEHKVCRGRSEAGKLVCATSRQAARQQWGELGLHHRMSARSNVGTASQSDWEDRGQARRHRREVARQQREALSRLNQAAPGDKGIGAAPRRAGAGRVIRWAGRIWARRPPSAQNEAEIWLYTLSPVTRRTQLLDPEGPQRFLTLKRRTQILREIDDEMRWVKRTP